MSRPMLADIDLEHAWHQVRRLFDDETCPPALRYRANARLSGRAAARPSPTEIECHEDWRQITAQQRDDGSFGEHDNAVRRILPTLWTLRSLHDLGGGPGFRAWARAAEFLCKRALVDGAFSIDGQKAGVLSCYTSIFASVLARGQHEGLTGDELAPSQHAALGGLLDWLERYQQVRRRTVNRRRAPLEIYDQSLATRYGGCFASTTCFTGLVRAAEAFVAANRACDLLTEIREDLLERKLFLTSQGAILPLTSRGPASATKAAAWLRIHYPTAYHVDLVEVLAAVAASGKFDPRMQPAIDQLLAQRLLDGTWPLQAKAKQPGLHAPERVSQRKGSPWATFRVLSALRDVSNGAQVSAGDRVFHRACRKL